MVISDAMYGISRSTTECGATEKDVECSAKRAKFLVDSRCSGKASCEFQLLHHKIPQLNCPINDHNRMRVTYECINKTSIIDICDVNSTDLPLSGYLASPGYPYLYPRTTECSVTLPAQPGDTVMLLLRDLFIETRNATACLDYLMIEDTEIVKKKYCETVFDIKTPVPLLSTLSGYQQIHFRTDSTLDDKDSRGFLLKYKVTHRGPRLTSTIPPTYLSTQSSSIFWKRPSSRVRPMTGPTAGTTAPRPNTTPRTPPVITTLATTPLTTQNDTESTMLMSPTEPALQPNMSTFPTTKPTETTKFTFTPTRSRTVSVPQSSTTSRTTPATTSQPPVSRPNQYTSTTSSVKPATSTTTEAPPVVAPGQGSGLSDDETVAVIIVVLFVVAGLVLIFVLVCCIKSRRKKKEVDKFAVSYNTGSSLLSFPSRESSTSTSSNTPLDLCFSNNVYGYDFDVNARGTVVVDKRNVHVVEVDDLPAELHKKAEDEKKQEASVEVDHDYAVITLPAEGATAKPAEVATAEANTEPYESAEQGTQALQDPNDIFIMDLDAQDRKHRREAARQDEPPNDCGYDVPLAREESMRMNAVPEIVLDHDVICTDLQNEENAQREEQRLDAIGEEDDVESLSPSEAAVCRSEGDDSGRRSELDGSVSTLHSDNTNNNASFSDDSDDFISIFGGILESTDL
ncbi:hypothetical protein CAPTEDRAFT_198380 [Capitella teleta]|uniref:CUB domain-containing protein n=1 Tax=Capitella teleta TaxID=283909 RepID=R7UJK2_CAPTE|nr:hypothetical protein CAPTEDRAFT_198380 [Capitella teleta]|eukprot:ELU06395.1 hypothetical protein CAPTEDRAFT_198380 [Capitella teleta]